MRIKWNGDTALNTIHNLSDLEQVLSDCLKAAQGIRLELDDLNPGGNSKGMNKFINRYDDVVNQLLNTEQELEGLVDAARRVAVRFDDAENHICRIMGNLSEKSNSTNLQRARDFDTFASSPAADVLHAEAYADWPLPEPIALPEMRLNIVPQSMEWLYSLLKVNEQLFSDTVI